MDIFDGPSASTTAARKIDVKSLATELRNDRLVVTAEQERVRDLYQTLEDRERKLASDTFRARQLKWLFGALVHPSAAATSSGVSSSRAAELATRIDGADVVEAHKLLGHYHSRVAQCISILARNPTAVADLLAANNTVDTESAASAVYTTSSATGGASIVFDTTSPHSHCHVDRDSRNTVPLAGLPSSRTALGRALLSRRQIDSSLTGHILTGDDQIASLASAAGTALWNGVLAALPPISTPILQSSSDPKRFLANVLSAAAAAAMDNEEEEDAEVLPPSCRRIKIEVVDDEDGVTPSESASNIGATGDTDEREDDDDDGKENVRPIRQQKITKTAPKAKRTARLRTPSRVRRTTRATMSAARSTGGDGQNMDID